MQIGELAAIEHSGVDYDVQITLLVVLLNDIAQFENGGLVDSIRGPESANAPWRPQLA